MDKNYLGIDWGAAKVGLSLGHEETRIAMGYGVIQNDEKLLLSLEEIIRKENIDAVVIGVPKHTALQGGVFGGEALGKELEKRFPLTVFYADEMFTSKMAQSNLIERGGRAALKEDDQEAARLILQAWLEKPLQS